MDEILSSEHSLFIQKVISTKDLELLADCDGYQDMKQIAEYLDKFDITREFALPIVRGHAYYTGMVAEFFLKEDMELGAIAG